MSSNARYKYNQSPPNVQQRLFHGFYVRKRPWEISYDAAKRCLGSNFPREHFIIPEEGDRITSEGYEFDIPGHPQKIIVPFVWPVGW